MGFLRRSKDRQQQSENGFTAAPTAATVIPSGANLERQLRYAELSRKLMAAGSEAPAVIRAIGSGEAEAVTGAIPAEFEVTIKPSDGDAFDATIEQPMAPAALEAMSTGEAVTVRYDPDEPTSALICGGIDWDFSRT